METPTALVLLISLAVLFGLGIGGVAKALMFSKGNRGGQEGGGSLAPGGKRRASLVARSPLMMQLKQDWKKPSRIALHEQRTKAPGRLRWVVLKACIHSAEHVAPKDNQISPKNCNLTSSTGHLHHQDKH